MAQPVSEAFTTKKSSILKSLSVPSELYTDLSPKGSVDEGIRELIDELNNMEGVVTTSSCAGRISVFLEGSKASGSMRGDGTQIDAESSRKQSVVPAGKGMGGHWLFISHDPVDLQSLDGANPVHELFKLVPARTPQILPSTERLRLARFQFEPMILHIMTASLRHAQQVLTAALNAGFRESGVQGLKALDDAHSFPMVAVRSAGLGIGSVIGFADASLPSNSARSLVSEEYLKMMLVLGNERFVSNSERIARFRSEMTRLVSKGVGAGRSQEGDGWEDKKARAERKRREGLARQAAVKQERGEDGLDVEEVLDSNAILHADYVVFLMFNIPRNRAPTMIGCLSLNSQLSTL